MREALLPGEVLVAACHRHWVAVLRPLLLAALLALAAGTLSVTAAPSGVHLVLGPAVALAGGLWALAGWVRWETFSLQLTDRRLILSDGVLARATRVISLDRIQDVVTRQGPVGRVLGYGSLGIETAGPEAPRVVDHVPSVARFRDLVFAQVGGSAAAARPT
ncbi:MAG: PH domain-containing protein [Candidatus Dormibacterales bacterium]